ncbi:PadR family transcriptional regulator [Methanobrevibacter sp.]|uniref:PadR family transcriptional regulator n=1 Tax=Methanobrevibacter sp. TaxID=66852 RepID=UPI00386FC98A
MDKPLDSSFIKKDKIVQHTVNGISRFLMLWIIMENGPIHGYRIMKELDIFFENLIDVGSLKKSSASKIYPILRDMENNGLIKGDLKVKDNKKITYYEITDAGQYLIYYIRDSYQVIRSTSQGALFTEFLMTE